MAGGVLTRLAVAGLGLVGARHAAAVLAHPSARLAATVDPMAERRAAFDAPGFADIAEIDVALDGIILATPSALHADHAEAALARGWPCLVEKPIASDSAGADRIVAASAAAGLPVLTGHHRRYHGSVRALRDMIGAGAIGRPVAATAIWAMKKPDPYFQVPWRAGPDGSPVRINMVHEVDLLRFLLGEVEAVAALGAQPVRRAGRVESGAIALRFQNGCTASLVFADTGLSPWGFEAGTGENPNIGTTGQDYLFIAGTGGAVSFPSLTVWGGAADWGQAVAPTTHRVEVTDALAGQLDHFLDVIAGREAPLIDAVDARHTLDVILRIEAALEAAA